MSHASGLERSTHSQRAALGQLGVDFGATPSVRGNMPDPVPVVVLARLAVDTRAQGVKLGPSLLQDAVNRAVAVSYNAGVRALLVHTLHERAKLFYEHYGFRLHFNHNIWPDDQALC